MDFSESKTLKGFTRIIYLNYFLDCFRGFAFSKKHQVDHPSFFIKLSTLLAGFTVICGCQTEHSSRTKSFMYNLLASILQFITAPFVIGWVWSIMWGVTFVNVSVSKGQDETIVTAHV